MALEETAACNSPPAPAPPQSDQMGSECPLCFGQEPHSRDGPGGWSRDPLVVGLRASGVGGGTQGHAAHAHAPARRGRLGPGAPAAARGTDLRPGAPRGEAAGPRAPAGAALAPGDGARGFPGLAGTACAAATRPPVRVPSQEMSSYWKDRCCLLQRVAESATNLHMHLVTKNFVFVLGSVPLEPAFKKATCRVPVRK